MTAMGWFGLVLVVGGFLAFIGTPRTDENDRYHRMWDPD